MSREHSDPSNLQSNEDNDSSVYEVPALPSGETRMRFLADLSEAEKTTEEASHVDLPILYGKNPITSESGTEGGNELDPVFQKTRLNRPSTSSVRMLDDGLPELSGRSLALHKTYFDEAKSFNFPQGHPTVIFSESQMNHLLRILADETLNMSYTTIERMVLDAVRGHPQLFPRGRTNSGYGLEPPLLSGFLTAIQVTPNQPQSMTCELKHQTLESPALWETFPYQKRVTARGRWPSFRNPSKNQVSLFQLPKSKRQQQLLYWGKGLNRSVVKMVV